MAPLSSQGSSLFCSQFTVFFFYSSEFVPVLPVMVEQVPEDVHDPLHVLSLPHSGQPSASWLSAGTADIIFLACLEVQNSVMKQKCWVLCYARCSKICLPGWKKKWCRTLHQGSPAEAASELMSRCVLEHPLSPGVPKDSQRQRTVLTDCTDGNSLLTPHMCWACKASAWVVHFLSRPSLWPWHGPRPDLHPAAPFYHRLELLCMILPSRVRLMTYHGPCRLLLGENVMHSGIMEDWLYPVIPCVTFQTF